MAELQKYEKKKLEEEKKQNEYYHHKPALEQQYREKPKPVQAAPFTDFQLTGHEYTVKICGFIEMSINQGDITKERVDVITNAANSYLGHAGGIALALVEAGGQ